ncbi:MAG: protein phosphatase 2C domain-containing protein [Clostridiales bacterium]|jgi:hypothetical protein|nr:protein phosphatase 2C domain-containing protein [Clostridiales bacterium]
MKYAYGVTRRGRSHERRGTVCQDAHFIFSRDELQIAAVADGLGSQTHSDMASQTASRVAVEFCANEIPKSMDDSAVLEIIRGAFQEAYNAVLCEADEMQFEYDQCDTTLSLAVLLDGFLYYGHAGDSGIFALWENGLYEQVTVPQNDEEGRVYPLCFGEDMWAFGKSALKAASVLLCTDGIAKIFVPAYFRAQETKLYVAMLDYYMDPRRHEFRAADGGNQTLVEWLENDLQTNVDPDKVNQDDLTMVILADSDAATVRQPDAYYRLPSEEEIRQAEENQRKRLYPSA